jgi:hypothetical protein
MAIIYKAELIYDGDKGSKWLPISSFSVVGGASRSLNLKSARDISITSELEQARLYKNITLFMPPQTDHRDMVAALQLTNFAINKTVLYVTFEIFKYTDGQEIESLSLEDDKAIITKQPNVVADQLLMIEVSLPAAKLLYSKYDSKRQHLKTSVEAW